MTAFVDVELVGDFREVERMLAFLQAMLSPIGVAAFMNMHVGPYLQRRAEDRFFNEGDDAVGQWAPLSSASVEIRERLQVGGEHPINVRSGELEEWITQNDWKIVATPLGTEMIYPGSEPRSLGLREKMETAQRGRVSPSTVARPVLALSEHDLAYVVSTMAFWIAEGAKLL